MEIFTIQNLVIYLIVINIIGFLSMFWDKHKAKKGYYRTPEKTLLTIALIGGSIGSLIGMYTFRHKTQKPRFAVGIPVILILQVVIIVYTIFNL